MGTFNLTCCVTSTPIIDKEKCTILLFKPEVKDEIADPCNGIKWAFEKGFIDVFYGKYKGFGKVSGCPVNNICDTNQYLVYCICKSAWEYGIELTKSDSFKSQLEHINKTINLAFRIQEIDKKSLPNNDFVNACNKLESILSLDNYIGFGKEFTIMSALNSFCYNNHMDMFVESNRYGGQYMGLKEKKEWQKLRDERIKYLESKIEE